MAWIYYMNVVISTTIAFISIQHGKVKQQISLIAVNIEMQNGETILTGKLQILFLLFRRS